MELTGTRPVLKKLHLIGIPAKGPRISLCSDHSVSANAVYAVGLIKKSILSSYFLDSDKALEPQNPEKNLQELKTLEISKKLR